MATSRTFLVVGSTGAQGGSTVRALLKTTADIRVLALTRDTGSSKAQALANDPRVQLVQGDTKEPEKIFRSISGQVDGVFCVTVHGAKGFEEAQAEGLLDASIKHGVKHFVFSSADRGGEGVSDTNETHVPHIATKYRIEKYIREKTQGTATSWTFLRPVTFFDNLTPDFFGKGFAAMWKGVGKKPVQMVATSDIGFFAAKALLSPNEWVGRSIGIAGDSLNYEQANKVFEDTIGGEMPTTYCAIGNMIKVTKSDIGAMFKWFEHDGFNVDIAAARAEYPDLQDFSTWLNQSSGFRNSER